MIFYKFLILEIGPGKTRARLFETIITTDVTNPIAQKRSQRSFSVKGQAVNILGFLGPCNLCQAYSAIVVGK